jgi:hypothetical protein
MHEEWLSVLDVMQVPDSMDQVFTLVAVIALANFAFECIWS